MLKPLCKSFGNVPLNIFGKKVSLRLHKGRKQETAITALSVLKKQPICCSTKQKQNNILHTL